MHKTIGIGFGAKIVKMTLEEIVERRKIEKKNPLTANGGTDENKKPAEGTKSNDGPKENKQLDNSTRQ